MNRKQSRAAERTPPPGAEMATPYAAPGLSPATATLERLINEGLAHNAAGRLDHAIAAFEAAIAVNPQHPLAYANLGAMVRIRGQSERAVVLSRQAIALDPTMSIAHNNLGLALSDLQQHEEAVSAMEKALELTPQNPGTLTNLTHSLLQLGRFQDAVDACRRAITMKPDGPRAHSNLGSALFAMGKTEEAIAAFKDAVKLAPELAPPHKNLGLALMQLGRFAEGWPEYEWRWAADEIAIPTYPQPVWRGENVLGKTVLLYAEQGLGDAIHFARFAALVAVAGNCRVILQVHKPLVGLMRSMPAVAEVIALGAQPPAFDTHQALMSVPGIVGMTPQTIPAPVPYLNAEPGRVLRWREHLRGPGFKVGIVWQGKGETTMQQSRSATAAQFAALADIPGVRLISLQKDTATPDPRIETLGADFDSGPNAFLDTAAVMEVVDLVITIDTSVAHLAGALARPVWIALKHVPDWRWTMSGETTPWYPTARLFRQPSPGNWDPVFAEITAALRKTVAAAGTTSGAS